MVEFSSESGNCSSRIKMAENEIRRSRRRRCRCPFSRKNGHVVCTNLNVRCGERKQYSTVFEKENEKLRTKTHACFRVNSPKKLFRVMVVEDNPDIRNLYMQYLKAIGIPEFSQSENASQAKRMLEEGKRNGKIVNLIVSDIHMGSKEDSGHSLVDYVNERNFPANVILISADDNVESVNHPVVVDNIRKPFSCERLEQTVRKYF